jgi:hypothetical protein
MLLSWEHSMDMFLRYTADPGFPTGIEELGGHQSTVLKTVTHDRCVTENADQRISFLNEGNSGKKKYSFPLLLVQYSAHYVFTATNV